MTDAEINRAVAEARGYTVYHYSKSPTGYYMLMDAEFAAVVRYPDCHRATEAEAWADVPDVIHDPKAWMELLMEAATFGRPGIREQQIRQWQGSIVVGTKAFWAIDQSPTRAFALAFLKSKGVSV